MAGIATLDGAGYREYRCADLTEWVWLDDFHVAEGTVDLSHRAGEGSDSPWHILDVRGAKGDCQFAESSRRGAGIEKSYEASLHNDVSCGFNDGTHYAIQVAKSPTCTYHYSAIVPEGATPLESFPSPKGDAIIYHVRTAAIPQLMAWLHRIVPSIPARRVITEELWISSVDGTGMCKLGDVPGADTPLLDDIQWLPDGRQISFVYRNTLYVMPTASQ